MNLNREELLIGFIFGICFMPTTGLLALPVACICSILWAVSGAGESKLYRRLLVPLLVATSMVIVKHSLMPYLTVPGAFGILSLGYGIPDRTDKGSTLGRYWYSIDQEHANVLTRSTIYGLLITNYTVILMVFNG